MQYSYNKSCKVLADRKKSKTMACKQEGISMNVLAKLIRMNLFYEGLTKI